MAAKLHHFRRHNHATTTKKKQIKKVISLINSLSFGVMTKPSRRLKSFGTRTIGKYDEAHDLLDR
jgi:hypothetical protein